MDNQPSSEQDSEISSTSTPPIQKSEPKDPVPTEPATAEQLTEVEKQMTGFEKATLRWAKIAVLLSGLAAVFVCAQWYEMHEGGVDTHALAEQAKKQAEKMSDMSDAAEKIRKAAENMVIQDQRIADNAQQALDASNKQSKTALDATIANSRLDQRAWIGMLGNEPVEFNETDGFKGTVIFFNSGKTPAHKVQNSVGFITSSIPLAGPPANQIKALEFHSVPSIAPQGRYNALLNQVIAGEKVTESQLQGRQNIIARFQFLKAKRETLYIFGILKYDDVFGNHRETDWCLFLADPDTKQMAVCDSFNNIF